MSQGPVPQTDFLVWGQGLYWTRQTKENQNGYSLLFAIADTKKEWLAWYEFDGTGVPDRYIMNNGKHRRLGEASRFPRTFHTAEPMRVDELCGSYLYSRTGKNPTEKVLYQLANLKIQVSGRDIRVSLSCNTTFKIMVNMHMNIKKNSEYEDEDIPARSEWGYVTFAGLGLFSYPTKHINNIMQLRRREKAIFG